MPDKQSYNSVALKKSSYNQLVEIAEKENRPKGRELAGLIDKRHKQLFNNVA